MDEQNHMVLDGPVLLALPVEMAWVTVVNHVSLDGVMPAPGRADEDRRGVTTSTGVVIATDADGDV